MLSNINSYILFSTISLGLSGITLYKNKSLLAPPVLFFIFYWLSYTSTLYQPLLIGKGFPYQIIEYLITPTILSTTTGLLCFYIGTLISQKYITKQIHPSTPICINSIKYICILTHARNILLIALACLVSISVCLSIYVLFKGYIRLEAYTTLSDSGTLQLFNSIFRFYLPIQLLCVSIDSKCENYARPYTIIFISSFALIYAYIVGTRTPLYGVMMWFLMYNKIFSNKIRICFFILGICLYTIIPITRNAYETNVSDVANLILERPIPAFGSNLLVFTNVVYLVPKMIDYFFGRTYLYSIASFIPGDIFHFKQLTPARWFVENYVFQGNSGQDFCLEAEAYMNFGWLGPPAVLLMLGILFHKLYAIYRTQTSALVTCTYPALLLLLCGAIRTHSLTTLKLSIATIALCHILLKLSSFVFYNKSFEKSIHRF